LLRFATSKREKIKMKKIKGRKIQIEKIVSVQPENSSNSLIMMPKMDCAH